MKTLYRTLPLFILLWTLWVWQTPAPAQEAAPAPVVVHTQPMFDPSLMEFVKVFGLGGMIFVIWLFDYRRARTLESIIEQYDKAMQANAKRFDDTQQAHLAAFKDINERNMTAFKESMGAIQKVSEDAQGTAIMCATVNAKVAERLDYLSKERAAS